MLADRLPPEAVDSVLEGLSKSSGTAAFSMTEAALRLTFPNGPLRPLPPFKKLTEPQRKVVRALARLGPETWCRGNFTAILRSWNLPADQAKCRAYAKLGESN